MTNGKLTQQTQPGTGDVEPHRVHLLAAERELLIECHRHGVYLAMFRQLLAVSELASNWCEPERERMVTYCPDCLRDAARFNAEFGLTLDSLTSGVGR